MSREASEEFLSELAKTSSAEIQAEIHKGQFSVGR
jgi:hypothetical protein